MKPFGKPSSARRILFATGFALAGLATTAMATTETFTNGEVAAAFAQLNSALVAAHKTPLTSLAQASAANLETMVDEIVITGTATGVIPDPAGVGGDVGYILNDLTQFTSVKTSQITAAGGMYNEACAELLIVPAATPVAPSTWGGLVGNTIQNSQIALATLAANTHLQAALLASSTGSTPTTPAIAASICENSGSYGADVLAASLIGDAKTNVAEYQQIAVGVATDTKITTLAGGVDSFVLALANDIAGKPVSKTVDLPNIVSALAVQTAPGFSAPSIADDIAQGAVSIAAASATAATRAKDAAPVANAAALAVPAQAAAIAYAVAGDATILASGTGGDAGRESIGTGIITASNSVVGLVGSVGGVGTGNTAVLISSTISSLLSSNAARATFAGAVAADSSAANAMYIADAVAAQEAVGSATYYNDLATLASDVGAAKTVKGTSAVLTTATSVEQIAVNHAGTTASSLVTTATSFTQAFIKTEAYSAPTFAGIAALGQDLGLSGSIGVAVVENSTVIKNGTLAGAVAVQVAKGANTTVVNNLYSGVTPANGALATDEANAAFWLTAEPFALASTGTGATATALYAIDPKIAANLSTTIAGESTGVQNQADSVIAYEFTTALANQAAYTSKTVTTINNIVEALANADPANAAQIAGYAAAALAAVAATDGSTSATALTTTVLKGILGTPAYSVIITTGTTKAGVPILKTTTTKAVEGTLQKAVATAGLSTAELATLSTVFQNIERDLGWNLGSDNGVATAPQPTGGILTSNFYLGAGVSNNVLETVADEGPETPIQNY
jgi:hypothetical protein